MGARKTAAATLLLLSFAILIPTGARAATEQHLFDPTLSLTGTCSTDEADSVPDPWCPGPPKPSAKFETPNIAIDSFGDMYVSSSNEAATAGRIDVFSPQGNFITELAHDAAGSLAVDSEGNLYVNEFRPGGAHKVVLYEPTTYEPAAEEIAYPNTGEVIIENESGASPCSAKDAGGSVRLAVDPETDRLFVSPSSCVGEWSSASSPGGPELLDPDIGKGVLGISAFVAVDHTHNRLYVTEEDTASETDQIQVFELNAPHAHLGTLDGHTTPAGKFVGGHGWETIDAEEATGNLIVSELIKTKQVFEFGPGLGASEELLHTYEYSGFKVGGPFEMAVDNAETSPNYRSFYAPSAGASGIFHTFAFRFSVVAEPEVEAATASGVTETEAVLNATINPGGGETNYTIQYTTQPSFEGAPIAAEGTLPAGIAGVAIAAPLTGLSPGTTYRFRVFAENEVGSDEVEGSFRTYRAASIGGPCPNDALRTGFSAKLPDCRAYELVTPPDTNGLAPLGAGTFGPYFPTLHAAPDGSRASFRIEGGVIPGFEGAGSTNGDNYLATRGAGGWSTELAGPGGTEAITPAPGGFSPDQGYSFWEGEIEPGEGISRNPFIRYPDGHSERVGRGSLGTDSEVGARLIAQGGAHTIFNTAGEKAVRLEPAAPPSGTAAIYDRTIDPLTGAEATHVVSLLPGDITPPAGDDAHYLGASLDGKGVAFELKGSDELYLRLNDAVTYEVGEGLTYAGIAEGGGRVFYLKAGNLFAFDTTSKSAIQFSKGGDTTPVNVSPDGTTAYFLSPDVLTGTSPNPSGALPVIGEENLYVSHQGQLGFLGTVEPLDVEEAFGPSTDVLGLGQWLESVERGQPGVETSRTTPDGNALLFESRAPLTGYETDGHTEVYRYDSSPPELTCLSCNPTGLPATGDASLETIPRDGDVRRVVGLSDRIPNIRPDGNRAFFQSYEALVPSDTDGRQDIYEWEAQNVGSCTEPGGCIYLISSGQSARDEHLFAVSEEGNDAFFLSGELLLAGDKDTTTTLYDARVEGGFPEAEAPAPCQGEGCRGGLTPPPLLPVPATPAQGRSGNVSPPCPKGKHRVKRHGKVRCVKKKPHHHKASSKGGGSR